MARHLDEPDSTIEHEATGGHLVPLADVHVTELPHSAAGTGAVWSTMKHLARDSGLIRGARGLLKMNQPGGFDCPGCAWPEPHAAVRARFEFCENGAKALAEEQTTARATPKLFAERSISELRELTDFELGQLGRITHPLVRDGDHYKPIPWEAAFELVARELRTVGPDATALYTSGRTSNEAAFMYQLVGRMFGTNNFPDCSNMCHESSGVALSETVGVGKGTVSLDDFEHADLILIVGQNPGTNHPRMLTTLRECAKRGTVIVGLNPLHEVGIMRFAHPQNPIDMATGGVQLAKDYVQIPIGCDQAFFLGMAKATLEAGAEDLAFLDEFTTGFADYRAFVESTPWDLIVQRAGVPEGHIRRIAARYCEAKAVITCWAMGLTQHKNSVQTIQEVSNLMLLRGNVGRPGAGLCPVRGHSNVQGDRTMGIDHRPPKPFLDKLGAAFGFEPPRQHGVDVVEMIQEMEHGRTSAFFGLGGNIVSATPDTERTMRALSACALTVSVSTKVCRTHLYPGAVSLILPCLGRSEQDRQATGDQFVTVEDSMSMVHSSQGNLSPIGSDLRSEVAIVCGLGKALLGDRAPWDAFTADYDKIRDVISLVVPGFDDFNTRVRTKDGFQLPNVARDRTFKSIGGKAKFAISMPPDLTMPPGRLRMMTIRSHDQYNTTIYGLDDRYRGVKNERRVIFMNSADIVERHLVERQVVDLVSEFQGVLREVHDFIVLAYDIPRGNCATYFPEANALVPLESTADKSNTPTSKSVVITVRPATRPITR